MNQQFDEAIGHVLQMASEVVGTRTFLGLAVSRRIVKLMVAQ
jgi:hypothetical protein